MTTEHGAPATGDAPLTLDQVQALVTTWNAAKKTADAAILAEREARDALVKSVFPEIAEGAGNKADIGYGMMLQVTGTISRKIDVAQFDAMRAANQIPADIIDSVVRFKPDLVVGAWKSLPMSAKKLMADCVTESWGAPQVKIVPKKKPGEE